MSNTDASGEKRVTGTSERREQIIQRLRQQGSVQVNDLSALYGVSTVTIRNDLAFLEKQGIDYWSGVYKKDFLNRNHIRYNPTPGASYQDCGFFYKVMYCQPVTRLLNEAFYHYRTDNPDSSVRSTAKVACIHDEFLSICEFIEKNPENRQLFVPVFSQSMTGNYLFNYHRIAENRQVEFLNMMRQDLSYFLQAGVFSWKHLRPSLKIRCRILFASPCLFHWISCGWNILLRLETHKKQMKGPPS